MKKTAVYLVDAELVLLDGQCSEKTQQEVDAAKHRLQVVSTLPDMPPSQAAFIAQAVTTARATGRLTISRTDMHHCPVCDARSTYGTYSRATRGHRKGEKNYKHAILVYGVELNRGFISMVNYPALGICNACFTELRPLLANALVGIEVELPDELVVAGQARYKRYDRMLCTVCGWAGHEGEMDLLPALMSGYYPGRCPKCKAENRPFGVRAIKTVSGYVCVKCEAEAENAQV
jgi:hypothetical protein